MRALVTIGAIPAGTVHVEHIADGFVVQRLRDLTVLEDLGEVDAWLDAPRCVGDFFIVKDRRGFEVASIVITTDPKTCT